MIFLFWCWDWFLIEEVPPLLIFLLDSMILVLALRDFCSFSREEGGEGAPFPLTRESSLYNGRVGKAAI